MGEGAAPDVRLFPMKEKSMIANTQERGRATGEMPKASLNGSGKIPYDMGVPKLNTIALAPTLATIQLRRLSADSAPTKPQLGSRYDHSKVF
jgi:hypothetical protein